MKKVLIIGSKGFIGTHAYKYFSNSPGYVSWGCDVVVEYVDDHYFLIDASNSDFNEIFDTVSFDICINCSGAASVPDSLIHPFRDFTLNVFTVGKILEAMRKHSPACKFINLSSAAVYGNPQVLPVTTKSEIQPVSPYGFHKLYSEHLCKEYHSFFSLQTLSLRVFSVYGPGLKKQLFWDWYQKSLNNQAVDIYGTGSESRDFIYIDDLLQVISLAIQRGTFNGAAVNVANGNEVYIRDAAAFYLGYLNKKYVFKGEVKKGDPLNWVADITDITGWGYKNEIMLEEGLKRYIEWVKEFG